MPLDPFLWENTRVFEDKAAVPVCCLGAQVILSNFVRSHQLPLERHCCWSHQPGYYIWPLRIIEAVDRRWRERIENHIERQDYISQVQREELASPASEDEDEHEHTAQQDYISEVQGEDEDLECVVCMDARMSTKLLPCNHICMCADCEKKIHQRICPLCRTPINKTIYF